MPEATGVRQVELPALLCPPFLSYQMRRFFFTAGGAMG
jgi:hypothetical protein